MIRPRTQIGGVICCMFILTPLGKSSGINYPPPHKPLNLSTNFRFWAYMQEIPLSWLTWDAQVSRDLGLQCKP